MSNALMAQSLAALPCIRWHARCLHALPRRSLARAFVPHGSSASEFVAKSNRCAMLKTTTFRTIFEYSSIWKAAFALQTLSLHCSSNDVISQVSK